MYIQLDRDPDPDSPEYSPREDMIGRPIKDGDIVFHKNTWYGRPRNPADMTWHLISNLARITKIGRKYVYFEELDSPSDGVYTGFSYYLILIPNDAYLTSLFLEKL